MTAENTPMMEDGAQSQDLDFSWLDICVTGSPGDEIIVAHSPGWAEMNLSRPYLCDNVELYNAPEAHGLYRWSGYTLGCWAEDEPMVIKGGTWTPYRLARIIHPDAANEAIENAVDILDQYAGYITTVKAADLERHPYLPSVEQVAQDLRAALSCPNPEHIERAARALAARRHQYLYDRGDSSMSPAEYADRHWRDHAPDARVAVAA